jgi:hypothetical protein
VATLAASGNTIHLIKWDLICTKVRSKPDNNNAPVGWGTRAYITEMGWLMNIGRVVCASLWRTLEFVCGDKTKSQVNLRRRGGARTGMPVGGRRMVGMVSTRNDEPKEG